MIFIIIQKRVNKKQKVSDTPVDVPVEFNVSISATSTTVPCDQMEQPTKKGDYRNNRIRSALVYGYILDATIVINPYKMKHGTRSGEWQKVLDIVNDRLKEKTEQGMENPVDQKYVYDRIQVLNNNYKDRQMIVDTASDAVAEDKTTSLIHSIQKIDSFLYI